ncbi:uncharacterized protein [Zea mays]|nr:uncharacterized protein LOC100274827 isoform X2 [Zea mays]|eukprot:XP_008658332.1 uncharacterized protein LOC100274827 isoform X3 [Zea mays]
MASPDLLFNLRNLFYLGAYQAAINNIDILGLDAAAAAERDAIVFRSYIALGSYQVRTHLASGASAATSLQAVKLLALYLTGDKVCHEEDQHLQAERQVPADRLPRGNACAPNTGRQEDSSRAGEIGNDDTLWRISPRR